MKLRLLIGLMIVAAVTLALAGWAVQGIRRTLRGGQVRRPRLAAAYSRSG